MLRTDIFGYEWNLYPHKAAYLPALKTLLASDLHLGKVNHFRRSGIPLPQAANDKNSEVLIDLLQIVKPERFIVLGDLFHSDYNSEWEVFGQIRGHFNQLSFELVPGNHDVMSKYQYEKNDIIIHPEHFKLDNLLLSHDEVDIVPNELVNVSGHVHPGVQLKGKGRQSVTLPCFYFSERNILLPAFGMFTGLHRIKPNKKDKVFVVVDNNVIAIE